MELTVKCSCGNIGKIFEDVDGEGQIQSFEIMTDDDLTIRITCLNCYKTITL